MAPNGTTIKVVSPIKLAHVVLRTNKFDQMRQYYIDFLGGHAVYQSEDIAFITYDDEHHRIAIVNMPTLQDNKERVRTGLEHMAFTFEDLHSLFAAYKQRKALGITPGWCVNHGPTVSMYYRDPDGNQLETQVDCVTPDEATAFMSSAAYDKNFLGEDFDPDEFCRRLDAGESQEKLMERHDVGPRGLEALVEVERKMAQSQTGFA